MEFPTFTQLQYFVAVAQHGSFSAAAKTIPVTRQAVAKSISDLENVLGVNLVAKEGNAQVLTPAGRELRPLAESIIVNVQALMGFADEQGFTGNEGKVVLAVANESCRGEILSESDLKVLSRSIPGLTVQVERFDADACLVALETGVADAALVLGEPRARVEPLAIYRVSEPRACVAVSATDELAKLDEVAIRQLEGRYVAIPANLSFLYQMFSQLFEREKVQIIWRRIGNGLDENRAFVDHGGIVVVGENSKLASDSKGIVSVPLGEGGGLRLPWSFVVRSSENKGLPMRLLQPIRQLARTAGGGVVIILLCRFRGAASRAARKSVQVARGEPRARPTSRTYEVLLFWTVSGRGRRRSFGQFLRKLIRIDSRGAQLAGCAPRLLSKDSRTRFFHLRIRVHSGQVAGFGSRCLQRQPIGGPCSG